MWHLEAAAIALAALNAFWGGFAKIPPAWLGAAPAVLSGAFPLPRPGAVPRGRSAARLFRPAGQRGAFAPSRRPVRRKIPRDSARP